MEHWPDHLDYSIPAGKFRQEIEPESRRRKTRGEFGGIICKWYRRRQNGVDPESWLVEVSHILRVFIGGTVGGGDGGGGSRELDSGKRRGRGLIGPWVFTRLMARDRVDNPVGSYRSSGATFSLLSLPSPASIYLLPILSNHEACFLPFIPPH